MEVEAQTDLLLLAKKNKSWPLIRCFAATDSEEDRRLASPYRTPIPRDFLCRPNDSIPIHSERSAESRKLLCQTVSSKAAILSSIHACFLLLDLIKLVILVNALNRTILRRSRTWNDPSLDSTDTTSPDEPAKRDGIAPIGGGLKCQDFFNSRAYVFLYPYRQLDRELGQGSLDVFAGIHACMRTPTLLSW